MSLLDKYKKKNDVGFIEFVKKLDTVTSKVMKELIFNCLLEDPVYTKFALENKIGFEYFLNLGKDEVFIVLQELQESDVILLRSIKNHPQENNFINQNLASMRLKQYQEQRDVEKITVALQEDARSRIMNVVYELKENGKLPSFNWKLPAVKILNGSNYITDQWGNYKKFYEDGVVVAITGQLNPKNERIGEWKNFYPNGARHAEGGYVNGQKENEWRFYYLNGNLKSVGHYKQNLKNGEWREYEVKKGFEEINDFKIIKYINGKIV